VNARRREWAQVKVTSAGNGFAINVSADDEATVTEIRKRAEGLKTHVASN
jgi:hypothetical protein